MVFACKICNTTLTDRSNLNRHIRTKHGDGDSFECFECGKTFSLKFNLKTHLLTHSKRRKVDSGERAMSDSLRPDASSSATPPPSSASLQPSTQPPGLSTSSEPAPPSPRFQCADCDKSYAHRRDLIRHMKSHKDAEFLCSSCGKVFTTADSRNRHTLFRCPVLMTEAVCIRDGIGNKS